MNDNDSVVPTWEVNVQSPIIEVKFKIILKYGGYFRLSKTSTKKRYCYGHQKCLYIDTWMYNYEELVEEATKRYPSDRDRTLTLCFVDKVEEGQSFIELNSQENFELMLSMYDAEKQVIVYVTTTNNDMGQDEAHEVRGDVDELDGDDESEYSLSDDSYHSHYSSENEEEIDDHADEALPRSKHIPTMKVKSKFENVVMFRRVLTHYALMNEFEYYLEKSEPTRVTARCVDIGCKWRIHASVLQDGITFEVKTFVDIHSCTRSNKGGNKLATQGWIASVVKDKLKSDGDVSVAELRKWVMKTFSIDVSYIKVFRGKEQAYNEMFGKWEESFMRMNDYKAELLQRNPGSVVEMDFEREGDKKLFMRFFISLFACSRGFLDGCRPYIALDACQEAVAYLAENHKKIWSRCKFGTLSKCDYITNNISEAFNSWIGDIRYQPVLDLLDSIREKIMVRFDKKRRLVKKWKGTLVPSTKSYLNKISKKLGEYEVSRSCENRAEVKWMDKRWEVCLDEQTCTCRVWQVRGIPCYHAAAFIAFTRDVNWENYVDRFFTIDKFKTAYALEVAPMPSKDQWMRVDNEDMIYPPRIKRPPGRPRKKRIVPNDEPKRRHKCRRCSGYGHHEKTCKNPSSQQA